LTRFNFESFCQFLELSSGKIRQNYTMQTTYSKQHDVNTVSYSIVGHRSCVINAQRLSTDLTGTWNPKEIDLNQLPFEGALSPTIETRYARRLSVITGRPYRPSVSLGTPGVSGPSTPGTFSLPDVSRQRSPDSPGLTSAALGPALTTIEE
jgi:hypothetical protein